MKRHYCDFCGYSGDTLEEFEHECLLVLNQTKPNRFIGYLRSLDYSYIFTMSCAVVLNYIFLCHSNLTTLEIFIEAFCFGAVFAKILQ